MKKGFTLIELLAVIVILAIIALIAAPIILGIINDARQESNERSIELYANAIRNGIAAHQLTTGNKVEAKAYKTEDLTFVEYEGDVECDTIEYYTDGRVYVADCKVNGVEVDYAYGTPQEIADSGSTQVFKPQYYHFDYDFGGTVGGTTLPENPSTEPPTGQNYYLGYDVTDGVVSAAYACFVRTKDGKDTEYCLKGYDTEAFATNNTILEEAFGESACSFGDGRSYCRADGLTAGAMSSGYVDAYDDIAICFVNDVGIFECYDK